MAFLVAGGAVRDILLGRPVRDVDVAFTWPEEEFIQANPAARKVSDGAHPVYILDGIEYAPVLDGDIAADLMRRDFTINALALDEYGVIRAHPKAFSDLAGRVIRPASPESFKNDPVRVLRAARMTATLPDFALSSEAATGMARLPHDELSGIPAEQAGKEVVKACTAEKPGNFLRALSQGRALAPWFCEFFGADAILAGPPRYHDSSVLEHTARVMDLTALKARREELSGKERVLAVWMAFCHDIGKTATPEEILPRHHGHEKRGEGLALKLGTRLSLPTRMIKAGSQAARLHMKAAGYVGLRPGTQVDLLTDLHNHDLLKPFFIMVEADSGQMGLWRLAKRDLDVILEVSLPEKWRDKGPESGRHLRELRAKKLLSERSYSLL